MRASVCNVKTPLMLELEHVDCVEQSSGIITVTMSNPPVNAMAAGLVQDLVTVFTRLQRTTGRVVVVSGAGANFSAGGDFHVFRQISTLDQAQAFVLAAQQLMNAVAAIPVPVIAAIHGNALGGGLELALACDLRVASPDSRLGLPETRWGILAGAGGTQRLARLIGAGAAKRMMFTAKPVTGIEAQRIGLVDVLADDPADEALTMAEQIAQNSPKAVRNVKRCVDEGINLPLPDGLKLERELWAELIPYGDLVEGSDAFFERREPIYGDYRE